MKRHFLTAIALAPLAVACGSAPPPEPVEPAPAPAPVVTEAPAPPPAPEPTEEEKKKAAALKQLEGERATWQAGLEKERARWTPELRAEATALASKDYPTGKAAITAAMAGKHRKPGNAERDKYRHPLETLELFGFKPNMTVLDIGPGDGWYTELLAPALAKKGKYLATNGDPNGPLEVRSTFYAQRFKGFVDTSSEAYGKVETLLVDSKAPKLDLDGKLDLAMIMRGVHGMVGAGTFGAWLGEIHKALKPSGVLGIEEHRAAEGADPVASAKQGYVPEKWLIEQVEAAGFKLKKKSEINANPKDTKDYPDGVWDLPPTLRRGDTDKDKYLAIGESDRMTLVFVKAPEAKKK